MKIILNEEQFKIYKNFLKENIEEARNITNQKAYKQKVQPLIDKLSSKLYGDELGTINDKQTEQFGLNKNPVINDMQLKTGLFSIGNAKLSDDTLIINFTSALQCPSVTVCPVSQMACYAVAGEVRLPNVRKKNLMIQNMWVRALKNDSLGEVFGIAQMYIDILKKTKKPIRYIRFNEAGDFINQKILDSAALFAYEMKKMYGVSSMAYTSNNRLDFTKQINGEAIDSIIKINASRLDVKTSDNAVKNNFLATSMDFSKVLSENDKVVSISDAELNNNHFECLGTLKDPETGSPSIPVLTKGSWSSGNGWYYVCPCSFWRYNKDKAALKLLQSFGKIGKNVEYLPTREISEIVKTLSTEENNKLKNIQNKIKSPCGTQCSVCHNMSGGVSLKDSKYPSDKWNMIKDYTVIEATHGATSGNYNVDYANEKRNGNDNVIYSKDNPYGRFKKFSKTNKGV